MNPRNPRNPRNPQHQAILFGDSIRAGYEPYVTDALADAFTIHVPIVNSPSSRTTLANVDSWLIAPILGAAERTVVHLNVGLHDLKHTDADGNPADRPNVSLDEYRDNLAQLLRTILDRTGLPSHRLVFALTTPVLDDRHNAVKSFIRHEADVQRYNAAATTVCHDLGVTLNDLHAFVLEHDPEILLTDDGVHYTDEGKARLGEVVAQVIREAIRSPR